MRLAPVSDAVARTVLATLRLARAQAVQRNTEIVVSIDPQTRTVTSPQGKWQLPDAFHVVLTYAETEKSAGCGRIALFTPRRSVQAAVKSAWARRKKCAADGELVLPARLGSNMTTDGAAWFYAR